jgi:NADPH:quinone reductase-like Zn-dependent oxidoreductase
MKAVVRDRYGGPEALSVQEVEEPVPGPDEVLVAVRASSVNMADVDYLRGRPWVTRLGTGVRVPRDRIMGTDLAGEVMAVGADVSRFEVGDRVFADLTDAGSGAWAERVAVPESTLTPLPDGIDLAAAGCTPSAGIFALQGVRDKRPVQAGDRVLVNGASGNVGPFAVQLAKHAGGEVTGTCRTDKTDLVRALGADHVIDYTAEDYRRSGERWDLIVDIAGRGGLLGTTRLLERGGGYVLIGGTGWAYLQAGVLGVPLGLVSGRRMGMLMWRVNDRDDMAELARLLATGAIKPHIDRTYGLDEIAAAVRHLESGDARGKLAVRVS